MPAEPLFDPDAPDDTPPDRDAPHSLLPNLRRLAAMSSIDLADLLARVIDWQGPAVAAFRAAVVDILTERDTR